MLKDVAHIDSRSGAINKKAEFSLYHSGVLHFEGQPWPAGPIVGGLHESETALSFRFRSSNALLCAPLRSLCNLFHFEFSVM